MLRLRLGGLSVSNPLIDWAPVKPFDPIARQAAAARSESQGRPHACQLLRTLIALQFAASKSGQPSLALDCSEHGGRVMALRDDVAWAVIRRGMTMLSACVMLSLAVSPSCADPQSHDERTAGSNRTISSADPLSAFVREAAERFAIPQRLLRAVMHVESVGDVHALSSKGAMGLMQIMPPTWEELRTKYRLGDDPYQPRDNIFAGAAYLREMLDRFGRNGFLAAYNAGPGRYEEHLATGRPLPRETIDYVRKLAPLINGAVSISPHARRGAGRASALDAAIFAHTGDIRKVVSSYGDHDPDVAANTMFPAIHSPRMRSPKGVAVVDLTAVEPQPGETGSVSKPVVPSLFVQRPSLSSR